MTLATQVCDILKILFCKAIGRYEPINFHHKDQEVVQMPEMLVHNIL